MSTPDPAPAPIGGRVFLVLVLWFSILLALGVGGWLRRLPPVTVPIGLVTSTLALVLVHRRSPSLQAWARRLDLGVLVGFHVVRAPIGLWFLMAHARGELPGELALRAGWGDIATGLLALLVLPLGLARVRDRRLLLAWNVFGALDIAMVVLTAQSLILFDPSQPLRDAANFPFVMLPWFVVPLVFVTHALLFARLRAAGR